MKKAFSLFEMAMVMIVIALVLTALAQTDKFILHSSINSAQSLTKSSPVNSIDGLVAWYEATLEESFINSESEKNSSITTWYDINTKTTLKRNGSASGAAKPTYIINSAAKLPILKFNGTANYFTLPDATVPYGNSSYSVFFVAKAYNLHAGGLLGSGIYGTTNKANAFRYTSDGKIKNYWWNADSLGGPIVVDKLQILTFIYDNSLTGNRKIYIDGVSSAEADPATDARLSAVANNTIGVTNSNEFLNGEIGEIIIFERDLDTSERTAVHNYLSKKWGIKIS